VKKNIEKNVNIEVEVEVTVESANIVIGIRKNDIKAEKFLLIVTLHD